MKTKKRRRSAADEIRIEWLLGERRRLYSSIERYRRRQEEARKDLESVEDRLRGEFPDVELS